MEDLFKFMLIRGVEKSSSSDTIIQVSGSPNSKGAFEQSLEKLKEKNAKRNDYETAAGQHKKSNDYIKQIETISVDFSDLEKALMSHKGKLSINEFKTYANGKIRMIDQTGAFKPVDPKVLIDHLEFKNLKTKIIDSILAVSILPESTPLHHDNLMKFLKLSHLIELAFNDKWPFNEMLDFRGIMNRFVVVLPQTIFPLPSIEKSVKSDAEDKLKQAEAQKILDSKTKEKQIKLLKDTHRELTALVQKPDSVQQPSVVPTPAAVVREPGVLSRFSGFLFGKRSTSRTEVQKVDNTKPYYLKPSAFDSLSKDSKLILTERGFSPDNTYPQTAIKALEAEIKRLSAQPYKAARAYIVGQFVLGPEAVNQDIVHQRLLGDVEPDPKATFYYSGVTDLKIVRQKLIGYELGDFAHVENVLAGEKRLRSHRRLERTEEEKAKIEKSDTETEKETQSTTRNEIQIEAAQAIEQEFSIAGSVTASSYGPGYNITGNVSGGLKQQTSSSSRRASNFSQDIVQKAVERFKESSLTEERRRKIQEMEEKFKHEVNNAYPNAKHIRGIYRWLNKIYEAQVYNYGKRHMFDFIIPEPAAFYLWSIVSSESGITCPKEISLEELEKKLDDDLSDPENNSNWISEAIKYGAIGVNPPPADKCIAWPKSGGAEPPGHFSNSDKITIEEGYEAYHAELLTKAVVHDDPGSRVRIEKAEARYEDEVTKVDFEHPYRKEIAISHYAWDVHQYVVNVNVLCRPTDDLKRQWKLETIEAIMEGYQRQKREYEDKLASASIGEGIAIPGSNPEENKKMIKAELQRLCISLFMKNHLENFNPFEIRMPGKPLNWRINFDKAKEHAIDVRFFQHAFEWENMLYIFYPYFWGRSAHWATKLQELSDPDPNLAAFLRAGAVRVQVPVREEFGEIVINFAQTGKVELGDHVPIVGDSLYVAAVDEVKEALGSPDLAEPDPEDPWEVVVPTSLVILQGADEITFRDPLQGDDVKSTFNNSIDKGADVKLTFNNSIPSGNGDEEEDIG